MRSPGAGRSGGLGGSGLAAFGAARFAGAFLRAGFLAGFVTFPRAGFLAGFVTFPRAGFPAGFATFLRTAGRLAGTFLRFAFAFFLTAMRPSRRQAPPDPNAYSAPFEPRRAR
jgi:hypothetical protein